jgi:cellulose synthase/poly-beta-1,6-N-acetylglucosamine synthase-like glycosyltransferase
MQNLASYLLVAAAAVLIVPIAVFTFEAVAAAFSRRSNSSGPNLRSLDPRLGILIPAHNESIDLKATLRNIKSQIQDSDRLLVVADNCTDDTSKVASSSGAEVIERNDLSQIGKGYALDFGVKYFAADPPEVLVIIDADCCFTPGSLGYLGRFCYDRNKPVQSLNLMIAPEEFRARFQFDEFAWRVKNWVRPLGLSAFDLPCQLTGTGMAFPWAAICSLNLATGDIVEDLKLGLELARAGNAPVFCSSACVVSRFPDSLEGEVSQRQRWEQGHLKTIANTVPHLIWAALRSCNLSLLVLTLDLAVPPLSALLIGTTILLVFSGLAVLLGLPTTSFYIAATGLAALSVGILLSWAKFGRDVLPARSILMLPVHLLKKVKLYVRILFHRRTSNQWIRTDRSKTK